MNDKAKDTLPFPHMVFCKEVNGKKYIREEYTTYEAVKKSYVEKYSRLLNGECSQINLGKDENKSFKRDETKFSKFVSAFSDEIKWHIDYKADGKDKNINLKAIIDEGWSEPEFIRAWNNGYEAGFKAGVEAVLNYLGCREKYI